MSIEWFRDLAICIAALISTAAIVFIAVLVYACYRKVSPVIDSVKSTTATVQGISSCVRDDIARPLAEVIAIIQGVSQGINVVSKLFKQKEEGGNHSGLCFTTP